MFDYIVVGAGSAGCVLAHRLSQDPGCRILLLEAGAEDHYPLIHIPGWFGRLQDTQFDWAYRTLPQPQLRGRRIFHPRGRVLGGSSSINIMIYVRGQREDFDGWRDLGCEGWDYKSVLPYFRRAEGTMDPSDDVLGRSGPLAIAVIDPPHPLVDTYLAAAQEAGIPYNADYNGERQEGCAPLKTTVVDGRRMSTAVAYLRPARERKNLKVLTHSYATKLLIENGRAIGVEYLLGGKPERAMATAEVIVSAGALNTPHLLMLSGIGPAAELERAGVPVLHDLPGVGSNLQDHLGVRVRCEITRPITFVAASQEARQSAEAAYADGRGGPLRSNFAEAGCFVRSSPEAHTPDLQLFLLSRLFPTFPEGEGPLQHGVTLSGYVLRPKSRGRVSIASADPLDRPVIDANYFTHADDIAGSVAVIRWNRRILHAKAFAGLLGRELSPGPELIDEAAIETYVRTTASTTWHVAGTCKMGIDAMAVVDPALRVKGIDRLRVADASIMPTLVSGNTNASVIMIGEKAADLIRS